MSTSDVCSELDTCELPSPVSHSNLSRLWSRILANWATTVIFLLLCPVVAYLISQLFGVRATQFLLRLRSSTLFEWMLLFVTFALGTVFLVLHELRVSSGVPYVLKWVASWVGEADGGVGWQQLVFPLCLALRAVHLLFDFFRPDIHTVLVWLGLLRHDVADSLEQHSPRSRLWWIMALDIVLLSGTAMTGLLVFPWSDSALREEFQLPWLEWLAELLLTLAVCLLLSYLLWWFVPLVTWSRLHHQTPCDGIDHSFTGIGPKNRITHVDVGNLHKAGLVSHLAPNSQPIFLRKEAIHQYVWLHKFMAGKLGGRVKARVAHIAGPPGTGKSTITWAWVCELARQQPVVWVHHPSVLREPSTVTLVAGGVVASFVLPGENYVHVFNIVAWAGVRLLVVDGVKQESAQLAAVARVWATADPLRRKVVMVSSAQLAIDGVAMRMHAIAFREVFSWKKEDYVAACLDAAFWNHVKANLGWEQPAGDQPRTAADEVSYKETLIDRRFFLAGASARWMFAFTTDDLRREINVVVHRVQHAGNAVGHQEGERARDAVNKAYARFQGPMHGPSVQCLVSARMTRLLGDRCDLNFIVTATRQNLPPGADGNVFEMDFRHHIKQAQRRFLTGDVDNNFVTVYSRRAPHWDCVRLRVAHFLEFDHVADVELMDIVDYTWFLPRDHYQGGYDAAFYTNGCLFTLQVTRGRTHTEFWQYMNELAETVHARLIALGRPAEPPQQHGLQFIEHIYVIQWPMLELSIMDE